MLTGSLAVLADAVHMLSDNLSLALALFASWLAGVAVREGIETWRGEGCADCC